MTPGRALDAEVAEKVMGLEIWRDSGAIFAGPPSSHPDTWTVPEYSTSIVAAWTVVEKLRLAVIPDASGGWRAGHEPYVGPHWYEVNVNDWEWAETAPEAICKAALMAVQPESPTLIKESPWTA